MMLVSADIIFATHSHQHAGEKRTSGRLRQQLKAKGAATLGEILTLSLAEVNRWHGNGDTAMKYFTAQLNKLGYEPEELLRLKDDIQESGLVETLSLQDLEAPLDKFVTVLLDPPVEEKSEIGSILYNHIITRLSPEERAGLKFDDIQALAENPEIQRAFARSARDILRTTKHVLRKAKGLDV